MLWECVLDCVSTLGERETAIDLAKVAAHLDALESLCRFENIADSTSLGITDLIGINNTKM